MLSVSSAEGSAGGQNGDMVVFVFLISTFTREGAGSEEDGRAGCRPKRSGGS